MNILPASIALNIANFQSQALSSLGSSSSDAKNSDILETTFSLLASSVVSTGSSGSASFQSQMFNSLMNSSTGVTSSDIWAAMSPFQSSNSATTDAIALLTPVSNVKSSSVTSLSPTGRNMALFDPESAYKMMTVINNNEVVDKAQFSELSQMKSSVSHMQDAGQSLGSIALATDNDSIKSQLQDFVAQYNDWVQRFNPDIQKGGLLADTQAAQVSLFELEQSVKNIFNGSKDGLHGLNDVGITIDPNTKLASLDTTKLDSMLATNKQGVVDTVQEFSTNFTKSASLLNAEDNVIPKQLRNLNNVIHYIADNKDSLQKEFGTGNAAKPSGQVAQALAAYNQTNGVQAAASPKAAGVSVARIEETVV